MFIPFIVVAQGSDTGLVPCNGIDCNLCSLVALISKVINFLIMLSVPIAVSLFAYAGALLFTSGTNPGNREKAKHIFPIAAFGFIIALMAWLIIDTILHTLVDKGYWRGIGPNWHTIQCSNQERPTNKSVSEWIGGIFGGKGVQPGTQAPSVQVVPESRGGGGVYDDATARAILSSNGIVPNKENCTSPTQTNCTSLQGVNQATIDQIVNLQSACNCGAFVLTGGTENGHASGALSHGNGYKVDIGLYSKLDSFIENNFTAAGTRSDGARLWKDASGNIYAREGDHWDITVTNVGPVVTS